MRGEHHSFWKTLSTLILLLALLAAAWPGGVRGQGPEPQTEMGRFLEARIREPGLFPRYPAASTEGPAGPQEVRPGHIETVDATYEGSLYPSQAQGRRGLPHAGYNSRSTGMLKYAVVPYDLANWSKLTFASYRDWQTLDWEVYTANGDGTNPIRRSNNPDVDFTPEFDRGTTRIVFVATRDGNSEIYKMNADGSDQTRLTWTGYDEYLPTWSPDGGKIAFYCYPDSPANAEVYVMNADGSNRTRLTWDPAWDGHPTWSPDGSRIAFVSYRSGAYDLWTMNADGSNQQQLTFAVSYAAYPDWSPDGSRIALSDDFNGDGWLDLAIVNADGTGLVHPLGPSPYPYDNAGPVWAPHGEDLAFFKVQWIYYQGSWYWVDAYIYGLDLSDSSTYLLADSGFDWWPDWQPTDVSAPSSQVAVLPAWSETTFTVQWSGSDGGGSGLRSYDVQYKDGSEGAWTDWLV